MRFHFIVAVLIAGAASVAAAGAEVRVGVAALDVTPDYPVRLSGFGFRRAESEGVAQKIWAKALAIAGAEGGAAGGGPAVLITVDNLGVPLSMTRDVAGRLAAKAKLDPRRLAVTASHTHTAPMLAGVCPTLFGEPIPPEHQQRIDRYTKELADALEQVALAALADLKPAELEFGVGTADLAVNRRRQGGPVDHDLPVLVARGEGGTPRAIYLSYACHCVTLSHNHVGGDWAGYLQEAIEKKYPGAVALTSIGCGADANPRSGVTGDKVDVAAAQGEQLAAEVERLLARPLSPVTEPVAVNNGEVELLFDTPPTREQWQEKAKRTDAVGYHARVQLDKLARGERLPTELAYPIQTWAFGDQLAMVFLPGEVVADYSVRLKKEFDRSRLWVNAYSNDAPCYIPSERVLKEGGYEGGDAMVYYDKPAKFAPGLEQKIVDEVRRQLPPAFRAPQGTEGVAPKSPEASRQTIRTKPGLEVELVAAEPLVSSPVAIDWGPDGRLWVCEMFDYPAGPDGNFTPGGRVRFLEDADGDGRYDKSTVFLDDIPFPTGVTAFGRGVLVCAAPDVLFAEDADGDGRAESVRKLFSGFHTDNFQARVNSLSLGLDNWVYGANGLLGGAIAGHDGSTADIRNRDFRFTAAGFGSVETVTGLTQQGRVRDDWGRWFGCDNSTPLMYYPHEQRYLRRNPHAPSPPPIVRPPMQGGDGGRIYPISRLLDRFNDPDNANRFTSACGLGVYRDTLLGEQFYGNAFVAETVHNLVHRMVLEGDGPGLTRRRAEGEREAEFLASADNWFRPVQVRTGPDGALYVVDMYRFLVEHPRWIPPNRLAQLDVRAGADRGRIYRLRPAGNTPLRVVRDLTKLGAAEVAAVLDSPNGTERDRVHLELLTRQDRAARPALETLATKAALPQVRLQALSALAALGGVDHRTLLAALKDPDPRVRAHAVRWCERDLARTGPHLVALVQDDAPAVRRQLAYTLGEWRDPRAGGALAQLVKTSLGDAEMRTAVLSSAAAHCAAVLSAVTATPPGAPGRAEWVAPLVATAAASDDPALRRAALAAVLPAAAAPATPAHFAALASFLDAVEARGGITEDVRNAVAPALDAARRLAADGAAPAYDRAAAVRLLGRRDAAAADVEMLCDLAASAPAGELRTAALAALRRQTGPAVAGRLVARWRAVSPAARADLVGLLLTRDEWSAALLAAVKAGTVARGEIPLAERQRLATSGAASLRSLAAEVFPPQGGGSRAEVVARYASVSALAGDASRGREFFARDCAACHALGGVGHAVGPDLAALRGKDADYFVQNILDPAAVVEPRFVYYQVVTNDRRQITGVIQSDTQSGITLLSGNGVAETVARADVKEVRASGTSMMPEGFEASYTPQQMADLVAFLKSGDPPKPFPGNTPRVITASGDGVLVLPAEAADIHGHDIAFEAEYRNVGFWHGEGDRVAWAAQIAKPTSFDVWLEYACAASAAGNRFTVHVSGQTVRGVVAATGPDWSRYTRVKVGAVKVDAGRQRVTVRPDGPPKGALMDLRAVALVPQGADANWTAPATPLASSRSGPAGNREAASGEQVARTPAAVAKVILDKGLSNEAREAAVRANPQFAAELVAEMTRDLVPGTPEEYVRIPWIWRVAIACGRRDDAGQLRKLLDVSLPRQGQPMHDWQAVVIGGGAVMGASDRGHWPAKRVPEIIGDDAALLARWRRSLDLASPMADDEKVKTGTRYDALRMLGAEPWAKRGAQLTRYLAKGTHEELQAGAITGAGDVDAPEAAAALVAALPHLEGANRNLALDALLRTPARADVLLGAVESGAVNRTVLDDARKQKLLNHPDEKVRARAKQVLGA